MSNTASPANATPSASAALIPPPLGIRAVFRLARTALHLLYGAATLALIYPLVGRQKQLWLKRRWSAQLLGCMGIRLVANPKWAVPGAMLAANHVSWLDIFVINAVQPAAFVCKDDVRAWPLIGWMCAKTETIFIQRGNRRAAHRTTLDIEERLKQRQCVAVFPEGTTSDGSGLLSFHSAMLQPATDVGCDVQPVVLRYLDAQGRTSADAAYVGDTSLWQSLQAIAGAKNLTAEAHFLPPMAGSDRRQLTHQLRTSISAALTSPWQPATANESGSLSGLPAELPSIGHPIGSPNPAPVDSVPA